MAGMLTQAALINGSDLLKQNDGVLRESHVVAGQRNVRRQARLAGLAGNGGGECLLPVSFCTMSTGRHPPCSLPTTGLRSA